MNKLMFYINTIEAGGAQRVLVNLCNQFSECNYEVYLVTSYKTEWEYEVSEKVHRINLESSKIVDGFLVRNIRRVRELRKWCKRVKPDVLISFMAEPNYRALVATIGLDIKNIISVRNTPESEYYGVFQRILAKILFRITDGCVFQTVDAMSWFPRMIQNKSRIIMNQVDKKFFSVNRKNVDDKIVCIGRLTKQKNQALLINAFAKIASSFPDTFLEIWGEGDNHNSLLLQIEQLKLQNRVFLRGISNDIPLILSKAKVFVLCSDYEGMPNTLLEALAAGCPSISTDCPCGGPREIIRDGENGFLIGVNDEGELSNKLKMLLTDPSLAESIGRNAKMSAQRFKPDVIFQQWESYIKYIIDNDR